jgi:hypothetical protein
MDQLLAIASVDKVVMVEPAIFEIMVNLVDGTKASLRMNAFVLQSLLKAIEDLEPS